MILLLKKIPYAQLKYIYKQELKVSSMKQRVNLLKIRTLNLFHLNIMQFPLQNTHMYDPSSNNFYI